MSKYTTELRFIIESLNGLDTSEGYKSINDLIKNAVGKIFDFEYPIFDTAYKETLETKILKHFYTREIGLETYGLWKLKLDTKLNEIMPYYNKLYKSELIKINPLYTDSLKRQSNKVGAENSVRNETSNSNVESGTSRLSHENSNSSNSRNSVDSLKEGNNTSGNNVTQDNDTREFSNTPSGGLEGVLKSEYLTEASRDRKNQSQAGNSESNTSRNSNSAENSESADKRESVNTENQNTSENKAGSAESSINNLEDYLENVTGHSGISESRLLSEYRETFLNIDMQVIGELEELFMLLW